MKDSVLVRGTGCEAAGPRQRSGAQEALSGPFLLPLAWDRNPKVEAAERASEKLVGRRENKAGSCEAYSQWAGLWVRGKPGLLGRITDVSVGNFARRVNPRNFELLRF